MNRQDQLSGWGPETWEGPATSEAHASDTVFLLFVVFYFVFLSEGRKAREEEEATRETEGKGRFFFPSQIELLGATRAEKLPDW